jgi:hypothetical protein
MNRHASGQGGSTTSDGLPGRSVMSGGCQRTGGLCCADRGKEACTVHHQHQHSIRVEV